MSDACSSSRWVADGARYDAWFNQPWGAYASAVEHELLLGSVPPLAGLSVCDAGCGTGRFTARLEAEGAVVTGVDHDPVALAIARERVAGPLVEGDVQRLPFDRASFDVTFAVTVCEFTDDVVATIEELVRVTRPGGRVVIGSLNRRSPWGWWNRRQFRRPPWDAARFLTREQVDLILRRHGATRRAAGLFAPASLPGLSTWGPIVERAGRRTARRLATFETTSVALPERPTQVTGSTTSQDA